VAIDRRAARPAGAAGQILLDRARLRTLHRRAQASLGQSAP
jgi:hypothetical protein